MEDDDFFYLMRRSLDWLTENGVEDGRELMRVGLSLQLTALLHWPADQRALVVEWTRQQVDAAIMVMECGGTRQ